MQGTWLTFSIAFLIAGALVYLPGVLVGLAMKIRGILLLITAPLISVFLLCIAMPFASLASYKWNILPVVITTLVALVLSFFLCLFIKVHGKADVLRLADYRLPTFMAVVGGCVILANFLVNIEVPYALNQYFGFNYHYSVVASILQDGITPSLQSSDGLYAELVLPVFWHALVALVVQITSVTIPVGANAVASVFAAIVFPLSMLGFALTVSRNKYFLSTVGLLSCTSSFFPTLYFWFSGERVDIVAYSILPVVFMLLISLLLRLRLLVWWQNLILIVFSVLVLVFTLPSLLVVTAFLLMILLPYAAYKMGRDYDCGRSISGNIDFYTSARKYVDSGVAYRIVFTVLSVFISVALYFLLNFVIARYWSVSGVATAESLSNSDVLGGVVTIFAHAVDMSVLSNFALLINGFLTVFVLVGVLVCVRRGIYSWLGLSWLVFSVLSVLPAGLLNGEFARFLVALGFASRLVILPVLAIFEVVLLSVALLWLCEFLKFGKVAKGIGKGAGRTFSFSAKAVLLTVVAMLVLQLSPDLRYQYDKAVGSYFSLSATAGDEEYLYSKSELDFIRKTSGLIDDRYTVAGNPSKGGNASYFLEGHKNIFYEMADSAKSASDLKLVAEGLNEAGENVQVCKAVKALKLKYIYDFAGACYMGQDCEQDYAGLDNLVESGVAKVIADSGKGQRLLELSVCE